MRTHANIIRSVGQTRLARAMGLPMPTVHAWVTRDSIPGEYWKWFADQGLASLRELAEAAAAKKQNV